MSILRFFKIKRKKLGAILIEFAFAVPVLSGVLFFMTDAPRFYHIKSKMRSSTHFAANMIQNVSQFKKNKKITCADLSRIFCASFANQYSGLQLYAKGNTYPLGYSFSAYVYYVECYDINQARVVWALHIGKVSDSPEKCVVEFLTEKHENSIVNYITALSNPELIYKLENDKLTMTKEDAKIVIELAFVTKENLSDDDYKKRFGFIIMPIRPSIGKSYFNAVTVITPNPGVFDEIPPENNLQAN